MINSDVLYFAEQSREHAQALELLVEGHAVTENAVETLASAGVLIHNRNYIDGNDRELIAIARQHLLTASALLTVAAGAKA